MNIPGFNAESSLGPSRGMYRGKAVFGGLGAVKSGSGPALAGTMHPALERGWAGLTPVPQETAFTIPPLVRSKKCTTHYSGYVTYPMRLCRPPYTLPDVNLGFLDPGDRA